MKTLLLDKQYKPISFVPYRKMVRLIFNEKVRIISTWDDKYLYNDFKFPAVIALNDYVRKKPLTPRFNFKRIFQRDQYTCQYTGAALLPAELTIDHIIPKSKGGKSTWENCVTASWKVNAEKADRTPEEAGLVLLRPAKPPPDPLGLEYSTINIVHVDWGLYFPNFKY